MFFKVLAFVFMGELLFCSADYGVASNFPELKIHDAGPSQQYPWVGYTSHFPKTVPRPLLLYKWQPYVDPTYTAFWVSEKDTGHGPEFKGDDGGGIPHRFGGPKPSSIKGGNLIDSFSGPTGVLDTYNAPGPVSAPSDSYVEPTFDSSFEVSGPGPASGHVDTYIQPAQIQPVEVYHEPSQIIQASPVIHQVDDDYSDEAGAGSVDPRGVYRANAVAVGHQNAFIEPGELVHAEQYVGDGPYEAETSPQVQSIVPFVKPPHSEPLPLENEGAPKF